MYGDIGGSLFLGTDGEVHRQDHDTMEVAPEPDLRWRALAWAAAAEKVPELRAIPPARPGGVANCPGCHGAGRLTEATKVGQRLWCAGCWGLGWQWQVGHDVPPLLLEPR